MVKSRFHYSFPNHVDWFFQRESNENGRQICWISWGKQISLKRWLFIFLVSKDWLQDKGNVAKMRINLNILMHTCWLAALTHRPIHYGFHLKPGYWNKYTYLLSSRQRCKASWLNVASNLQLIVGRPLSTENWDLMTFNMKISKIRIFWLNIQKKSFYLLFSSTTWMFWLNGFQAERNTNSLHIARQIHDV